MSVISFVGLFATAPGLAADSLGRLFFTPAQRNVLDAGKSLGKAAPVVPVAPGPRNVFLSGVVTRSDAERTVWVNGKAYHDKSPDGIQVKTNPSAPATAEIHVTGRERPARVKVGQQLDLNSGRVSEQASRMPDADSATKSAEAMPPRLSHTKKSPATEEHPSPAAGDQGGSILAPPAR